jgi:hypothetical protein
MDTIKLKTSITLKEGLTTPIKIETEASQIQWTQPQPKNRRRVKVRRGQR